MYYYALQVRTRSEEKYIRMAATAQLEQNPKLHFPQRRMPIRRLGKTVNTLQSVFPGYIFLELEAPISTETVWYFRRVDGFFRFLRSNKEVKPLEGQDLKIVLHFISHGPVAEKSRVVFDNDDRIKVESGPLKGLEGNIVKVDKRKGRAKIKLDLYEDSFTIDLAFELLGKS